MKKIETGKTYTCHSSCNYDCIFSVKVLSRTEKTAMIIGILGESRRCKIYMDGSEEYLAPYRYSMAPTFHA
jgi:hypothetical protein